METFELQKLFILVIRKASQVRPSFKSWSESPEMASNEHEHITKPIKKPDVKRAIKTVQIVFITSDDLEYSI